jgi:ATP-dependent Clp protease ATP-binding subunit ClpC
LCASHWYLGTTVLRHRIEQSSKHVGSVPLVAGSLLVARIADRLRDEHGVTLQVDDALVGRLAAEGFDPEFGARPLKRHLRRTLERELTRAILEGRIDDGALVVATNAAESAIALEVREPVAV